MTDMGQDESGLPTDVAGTVVTVGTFDGFHRGHRDLVSRLVERARNSGYRSVMVTFEPHPLEVVNPASAPRMLAVDDERLELLAGSGLEYLAILPFTPTLAARDAESFVRDILEPRFRMRELVVGYDNGFGRGRSADSTALQKLGAARGFGVTVEEPVTLPDGQAVSSTLIRNAISHGDLDRAREALGRPYSISGRVVPGAARGRELGFRTLNLGTPPERKLLPPDGVYAVRASTPDGEFGGMMNLGARPTFQESARTLEAHLFDAAGEWYGRRVRIEVLARLRDVRRFDSPEALVAQLGEDERAARKALAEAPKNTISVDPVIGRT